MALIMKLAEFFIMGPQWLRGVFYHAREPSAGGLFKSRHACFGVARVLGAPGQEEVGSRGVGRGMVATSRVGCFEFTRALRVGLNGVARMVLKTGLAVEAGGWDGPHGWRLVARSEASWG